MIIAGFLGGFFWLVILGLILLPLIAIIDIVRNDFEGNHKLIWILLVLFLPYLGSILYFLIGGNQKIRRQ